jgi:hypothetical protein
MTKMANTAGKRKKNLQQDEDLLDLKTFGNYTEPNEARGNARRARWEPRYTGGTMHEKETGKYSSKSLEFLPDLDDPSITPDMVPKPAGWDDSGTKRRAKRVPTHGKKIGAGKATATKREKDELASTWRKTGPNSMKRGVGDGLSDNEAWWKDLGEKKARKKAQQNKLKPPRRR